MEKRLIKIKVIPNASRNEIGELYRNESGEDIQKIYVMSAPEDGKANKAVIELIAAKFQLRKSDIAIVKGEKSQEKLVEIEI